MQEVKKPSKRPLVFYYLIGMLILMVLNMTFFPSVLEKQVQEVSYSTFMSMTYEDNIGLVQIEGDEITFTDKAQEKIYKTTAIDSDTEMVQRVYEHGGDINRIDTQPGLLTSILVGWVLPLVPFLLIGYFIRKRMQKSMGGADGMMFGMGGGSGAKVYVPSSSGIRFADVAGEDEAKELLSEIVDFLHDPAKYAAIGAKLPKGALLAGPPGTGKTLLAKAVAGEANVPFFSIAGSEFVEMFVGRGAAKVRDLFKQANEKAPCIVFIDEIDTIGKKRDGQLAGNDEREQTLNQLLTEMDGFDGSKGVVVLAATNRPDSLDPALLRPGRFDRRIPVELPDLQGRIEILKVHARKIRLAEDVDFEPIAKTAAGASGAELANIVNEAALRAVRSGRQFATQEDLQESVEVVIAGYQKKSRVLSDEEKKIVAYHEVGHALVAALQNHSAPVQKITIIPRTSGALGYTLQVDDGDHFLMSKDELLNKIATYTGGRAAEQLVFHSITTGASNHHDHATGDIQTIGHNFRNRIQHVLYFAGTNRQRHDDGRNCHTHCLQEQRRNVDPGNRCQVAVISSLIRSVLESNGNSTNDDGQYLARSGQRDCQCDTCTNALMTCDNQNGRNDRSQSGVRRNCSTDVHPAQRDHFQRTTDNNTGFHIPKNDTHQGTRD